MPTVRNILAIVGDSNTTEATLATALRAGRHLNCHVEALHVRSDPATALPLVGDAMPGPMVDEMLGVAERDSASRASRARSLYESVLTGLGLSPADGLPRPNETFSASWIEDAGPEEQVVTARACRADLLVLSRPERGGESASFLTLNAALMQGGRPVLVAPPVNENAPLKRGFERIALFWNGSPEATRAVAAALPFLIAAEEVVVLRVEEEEWFAPTEDLEAYLTRHGVRAMVSRVLPRDARTGRSLLIAAADAGADMMVMGAFTRSKLRQLILGSVTSYVMEHAALPVLLCH
jgi:nucleotide-binding universal stress UspA family protein